MLAFISRFIFMVWLSDFLCLTSCWQNAPVVVSGNVKLQFLAGSFPFNTDENTKESQAEKSFGKNGMTRGGVGNEKRLAKKHLEEEKSQARRIIEDLKDYQ